MKRVFQGSDPAMSGYLAELLKGHGIPCELRQQNLAGALGEVPVLDCWPEIWVPTAYAQWARELIEDLMADRHVPGAFWHCRACGERVEGQFAVCWRCGTPEST